MPPRPTGGLLIADLPSANRSTATRRTVLGATLWSVPTVSLAAASPAFAGSPGAANCVTSLTNTAAWTASSQLIRGRDTGWYVNGSWSGGSTTSNLVRSENQGWYRGINTESWNAQKPNLPDGTFLSFENNSSRTEDMTVTLS